MTVRNVIFTALHDNGWRAFADPTTDAILSALHAAGYVVAPKKLLSEAHACMRETGWHLATAGDVQGDGVLQAAVTEVEGQFAAMLAAAQESPDEG
jgi:hypothetical protein